MNREYHSCEKKKKRKVQHTNLVIMWMSRDT